MCSDVRDWQRPLYCYLTRWTQWQVGYTCVFVCVCVCVCHTQRGERVAGREQTTVFMTMPLSAAYPMLNPPSATNVVTKCQVLCCIGKCAHASSVCVCVCVCARTARREEGSSASGGGGEGGVRLLTTLLTEMDGMEDSTGMYVCMCVFVCVCVCVCALRLSVHECARYATHCTLLAWDCADSPCALFVLMPCVCVCVYIGVLVLGTTNRPQAVDSALLRPGRFDTLLHVPPPDLEGRTQVGACAEKQPPYVRLRVGCVRVMSVLWPPWLVLRACFYVIVGLYVGNPNHGHGLVS